MKKEDPREENYRNQNTTILNIIFLYFKIDEKITLKLNKQNTKMDFNNPKMKNHPLSPISFVYATQQ